MAHTSRAAVEIAKAEVVEETSKFFLAADDAAKLNDAMVQKTSTVAPARPVKADALAAMTKWCILAFLVFQNSAASLLMRASRQSGNSNSQTIVVMQELFKAVCCVLLLLRAGGTKELLGALTPSTEAAKTSVPALLYLFQNNMQYVAVAYLDASTYAILYQLKILTAGLMSVLILKKSLSSMQWCALVTLTAGASVVIVSQMTVNVSKEGSDDMMVLGVVAVLMACLASGFAGVYFEKLLKTSTMSLWARNLQLALYSLVVGCGSICQSSSGKPFFEGYSPVVWCSIVNNAFGGLLIAIVIKHADTILKNFSTTLSIIVTMCVSTIFFGSTISCWSLAGTALVIYAVFLYGGMSGFPAVASLLGFSKSGTR